MKHCCLFLLLLLCNTLQSQSDTTLIESIQVLHTPTGDLFGTLTMPRTGNKVPVALIHPGSGPTDRNGNSMLTRNNGLQQLAHALAQKGIASLRIDKRGIGESRTAMMKEADLRFDTYVHDAQGWLRQLRQDQRFGRLYMIGHSEGALVAMLAAPGLTDGYISIAGAGKPAAALIRDQLQNQPPAIKEAALPLLDSLAAGKTIANPPATLAALFRPSVQPYLISWFQHDPAKIMAQLKMPVLIVQGTTDLQVSTEDARLLAAAQPKARLVLIEGMNHVLKSAPSDPKQNMATYKQPELPLHPVLIAEVVAMISGK